MEIRMMTDMGLDALKAHIADHLEAYQKPKFIVEGEDYSTAVYPGFSPRALSYPALHFDPNEPFSSNDGNVKWQIDYENAKILFDFFTSEENAFPISLITDQRYIVYLTHYVYFDYMKWRWPVIPSKDEKEIKAAVNRVLTRYCYGRAPYARNAILSLFWICAIVYRSTSNKQEGDDLLKCYFQTRNAFDRILERTFSHNIDVFTNCLKAVNSLSDYKLITAHGRDKKLGLLLNNELGVVSLDALPKEDCYNIIDQFVKDIANGKYDYHKDAGDDSEEQIENSDNGEDDKIETVDEEDEQ